MPLNSSSHGKRPVAGGRRPAAGVAVRAPNVDGKRAWIPTAMLVVIFALLIPSNLEHPGAVAFGAPNTTVRLLKLALLGLGLLLVASRPRRAWQLLRSMNPFLVVFLVLMPLSILWSIAPDATIARYVYFLTIVVACIAFAMVGWYRDRMQVVLRVIITTFLLGSLVLGFLEPAMVLERGDDISLKDAWHGLASQKNEFGQIASFGIILWFHAWRTGERSKLASLLGLGISVACLVFSRSSTSLLATMFALMLAVVLTIRAPTMNLRRYIPFMVSVFAVITLVYAVGVLNLVPGVGSLVAPLAEIAGKDATFSNRAIIWQIIEENVRLHPVLGSGYSAYWIGDVPSSPSSIFPLRMYVYPTQSHNGYLEMVNDFGFVGLACLVGFLAGYLRQAVRLLAVDRNQAVLFICILFQQAVINMSESCWMSSRSASSIITLLATVALGRSLMQQKLLRTGRVR